MSSFRDLVKKVNDQNKTVSAAGQEQSTEKDEEKRSSFRDLVSKVNNGTIKVGTSLTGSQVDDWFSGISQTGKSAYEYLSKEGYKATNNTLLKDVNSYLYKAADVGQYLRANKSSLSNYDELMRTYNDTVNYLSNLKNGLKTSNDFYSTFDTQEDYDFWESHSTLENRQKWYSETDTRLTQMKTDQEEFSDLEDWYNEYARTNHVLETNDPVISSKINRYNELKKKYGSYNDFTSKIASLETEIQNYKNANYNEKGQYYGNKVLDDYTYEVTNRQDFDTTSANRNYVNPTKEELWDYDTSTSQGSVALSGGGYFDDEGNIRDADGNIVTSANAPEVKDKLGLFLSAGDEGVTEAYNLLSAGNGNNTNTWANIMQEGDVNGWKYLKETELAIYYALLDESQEAAYKFLSDMAPTLTRRETEEYQAYVEEAPLLEQILLNVASIPMSVLGGGIAFADDAVNVIKGEDINPYSRAHSMQNAATAIRSDTANDINNLTGNVALPYVGTTFGDAYQFIMSAADMYFGFQFGGTAYQALMSTGAASSTAKRLYEQGASLEQMASGGVLAGITEWFFEKYSIENLNSIKGMLGNQTIKSGDIIKKLLVQSGIEGTEEFFTEVSNTITNALVMGEQSDVQRYVDKYLANGDSNAQALAKALLFDVAPEALNAGIGGLVSGFAGGGGVAIATKSEYNQRVKNAGSTIMHAGGEDALLELSKEVAGAADTKTQNAISRQQAKVESKTAKGSKGKSTAKALGRLYNTVNIAIGEQNKADIATELKNSGVSSEKANAIADALVALTNGQMLTTEQEQLLKDAKGSVDQALQNLQKNTSFSERNTQMANFENAIAIGTMVRQHTEKAFTPDGKYKVSDTGEATVLETEVDVNGKTITKDTGEVIDIKRVASIHIDPDTKKVVMLLDIGDGKTVNAENVAYANKNDALLYESISSLGDKINAETANKLIGKYKGGDALVFARGMAQAYTYGFYGIDRSELTGKHSLTTELTEEQRNFAYGLGEQYRPVKDTADKAEARATRAPAEKGVYYRDKDGKATDISTYLKESNITLNDVQKTGIEMMRKMSEMLGVRFNVFESWVENGKRYYLDQYGVKTEGNPNGFYDTETGEIYIDLNAGVEYHGNTAYYPGTILFTVAHELTHFMRQWSPEHFTKIADIVFKHGGMKGNVSELIALKQARAKAKGKPISYDTAMEEVVADGMETILKDGKVVEFMAEVKQKDRVAWEKIKGWFKNLAKFLRKMVVAYRSHSAQTIEGQKVADFAENLLRQIEQIWAEGAVAAGENYQEAIDGYKAEQQQFSTDTMRGSTDGAVVKSDATTAMVEAKEQPRTEYEAFPKQMMNLTDGGGVILHSIEGLTSTKVNGLAGRGINGYTGRDVRGWAMGISGFTNAQINRVNEFMDTMADFMEDAGVTYKFIGLQDVKDAKLHYTYNADGSIKSIVLSAMVKNGDYPVNFDLSSICKKRVAMSKLIDTLAKRGSLDNGTVKLTPANIFKINTALKDAGYETACLGCFVESKRYNSLEWAKKFCDKWNAAVKKVNPNATYFGYGDASFTEDSFTLEQAIKVDDAANKYTTATKTERLANALKKYQAKADAGQPLVESFSKAAKDRLIKSDSISEELKTKYLNCDPTTLNIADVEFLLENGILPGASLSNKQAVSEMVKSGEAYQHLLRPSDLLTDRGISKLEALPNFHGVLYGHYGSGTPKLMQSYTPYNSEIALLPSKKGDQSLAEYLYTIAGVRMQSFSDFQIQNIYDYLQMVGDLAARKVPAHAYTKEISFAKLLGMTGIKVNLSVMFDIDPMVDKAHAGLTKLNKLVHRGEYAAVVLEDEQGKWVYNIGDYQTQRLFAEAYPDEAKRFLQSIGFGDAVKLQTSPGYSANCGIIGVGYSDLGIFAMLNDNRIRYIIPYHASSLPAEIKLATNIALGTDYTPYQNNMKIKEIVDRNGNKVSWTIKEAYKRLGSGQAVINELNEKIRNEGWVVSTGKAQTGHGTYGLYEDLQQTNDPRQTASNFMDWCIGNSTLPLFYQFASHENYYKLLYDYNVYDCVTEEYAPQQAVTNTYPTMVDGHVQPGNVTDGGFNAEYFKGAIDKQMAFMNEYSRTLDKDIDTLAENMEDGNYTLFSMRDTVEETRDLLAYHNITQQLLLDVLNRKGLLMPSLAVTNKGMTDFGEISLLFDKSTIDPAVNSENRLYGADAWTPTQTKLKKNAKFDTDKTVRAVNTVKNRIGSKFASELFNVSPKQFKETIIKADGSIYDAYAHNIGMQTAYAMEQGIISKIPTNKDGSINEEVLEKQLTKELDTDNGWRQYKKWLNNISDTIITSYDTATNEDILNNMKAQPATAKTFKLSESGELVVPAVEYSSIDDVRKNKNRLSENAAEATKAVADEFLALAKKIGDTKSVVDAINAAFANRYSTADIAKSFSSKGIKISNQTASELQSLYKKAVELPTQYFEAKPGREIGLDEVKTVVMPADSSYAELKGKLEEIGITVVEYDGSKESRVEALNSVENLKFSDRDSLTPDQQKHFDYNQKQKTVGSALKTLKGSAIKRSTKFGVGKEIGGEIYFHKDYAEDILPDEVLAQAQQLLEEEQPGFEYNCLKYNPKTGVVAFQEAPDFDTAREPVVGDYVSANTNTGVVKTGHSNYIWHHKWNWVKNDYSGFDVAESWNWSKKWLSTLTEVSDGNGIERWNAQLDKFGLPHDGAKYSEREQEYDSKDTSVKILPATFTKFGLKSTDRVLDWGGGQYDIAKKAIEHGYPGIKFEVVDAFNRTPTHNDRILAEYAENPATVLTINNVLNVIKETDIIEDVIRESKEYLAEDGVCYIKIYEGNDVDGKSGNGKVTSSGWQNNQPAEWYRQFAEKYYQYIERVGDILVASDKPIDRKSLPKASKEATESMRGKVKEIAKSEPSMRASLYSDRDTDSVSNRSLLANAFEGLAQTDAEKNKIQEYKSKISLIEAEEKKLRELNAQIKELSFAEGPRDTKKINALRFDATQAANRINTYDKQLLRLEASKPLQDVLAREKKRAYKKAAQEGKKALAKQKEKSAKTQRELIDRWKETRKKAIENRDKTAMRHKIQNVVGELNQLLLTDDKKRHVPTNLKKAVADALSLVNMDTVGAEERIAKYEALIAKETDPDKIDAYTVTLENIKRQGEKMGQRLKELRDAYEEISESDDPDIANAYDPVIAASLKELASSVGNTSLRNMTLEQLSDVYDMYKMVLTRVRDANKAFLNARNETISSLASSVVGEVRRIRGERKYRVASLDAVRAFSWNNLKPVYAMERIGSNTLIDAFNSVRNGEDTWAKDVGEAKAYFLDKSKKHGYDSWDLDKKYTFKSTSGLEFELTLEQVMSLYAYSKREQALDHLRLGGFVFDSNIETYKEKDGKSGKSILKYKVNTAEAHQLSADILADITGTLSSEQKAFVDDMQEYLSTVMGAKGNEVTTKLYGVKLFKEKFYFPLKSAKQFLFEQNEVAGEVRIKNSGFTNKVVARANNPVILNSFMDVWADHVNDMSMYHAFVLPLEDFNRIFNYKSPKKEGQPPVSVKGTIQGAYSPAAVDYVRQLITDLNGGAMADPRETFGKTMSAMFKKAKVFASLSVTIQQPSAIGRAFALVDPKYFRPTKDGMNHDQLWDELKQYAPVAVIKEMGYFDTNMGRSTRDFIKAKEYSGFMDKVKAFVTDEGYRDEKLSRLPALADELTWCAIWNAVKRETVATHKDLRPGSEEFLKAAGERFTEVITKTQVYDSILARSANMRSKSGLMSMVTAFMAEPTTTINMLEDAIIKSKRGNKKYAAKAFASVAVSVILNNALVALVYAGRDDDDDETYLEKYSQSFVSNMLDDINPITYYPYLKDVWSLLQGYDVERADMSLISDLVEASQTLVKAYTDEDGDVVGAWHDFAGTALNIGGVPAANIHREVNGGINFVKTLIEDANGRATTMRSIGDKLLETVKDSTPVWGWFPDEKKANNLYDAIVNGDTTYVNRMKGSYKSEDAYHSAVREALRENDARIKEAAIADYNGNPSERVRIARLIIADGFDQDDVVTAINAEINDMKPDKAGSDPKKKGYYTTEDFAKEIANGDQASADAAMEDIIATAQTNGKTAEEAEKSFKSSAKTELKELYLSGDISSDKTVDALITYCDLSETDAELQVEAYEWEAQGYDSATPAAVRDYNTYCATVSVPKDVYLYIRSFANNTENDKDANGKTINYSAMKKVMAEINAQSGLSSAQKTAIAKSLGWADKNIQKYKPW